MFIRNDWFWGFWFLKTADFNEQFAGVQAVHRLDALPTASPIDQQQAATSTDGQLNCCLSTWLSKN